MLDLGVGVGAPIGTGALLGLMSDTAGVLFICSLNTGTKFIEYLILLFVYRRDLSLTLKDETNGDGVSGSASNTEKPLDQVGVLYLLFKLLLSFCGEHTVLLHSKVPQLNADFRKN